MFRDFSVAITVTTQGPGCVSVRHLRYPWRDWSRWHDRSSKETNEKKKSNDDDERGRVERVTCFPTGWGSIHPFCWTEHIRFDLFDDLGGFGMKFDEFLFVFFGGMAIVVLGVVRPFDRMVGSTELVFFYGWSICRLMVQVWITKAWLRIINS